LSKATKTKRTYQKTSAGRKEASKDRVEKEGTTTLKVVKIIPSYIP